jgi:hypothetical protein
VIHLVGGEDRLEREAVLRLEREHQESVLAAAMEVHLFFF